MNFTSEEQARETLEEWRGQSEGAQLSKLRKALEALALNRMYYEDKGSERAAERVMRIMAVLEGRVAELEA